MQGLLFMIWESIERGLVRNISGSTRIVASHSLRWSEGLCSVGWNRLLILLPRYLDYID